MTMIPSTLVLYAHPYPDRSRAGRVLVEAASDLPSVAVRSLYDLYPDFAIDVEVEQAALLAARVVVWQCPFYWYGIPSLLHLWIEKVLAHGWAYGKGGTAVTGKRVLWVTTTGSPSETYATGGMHGHPFDAYVPSVEQTARFCGMHWEPPIVVHGAHRISEAELGAKAKEYRDRLIELAAAPSP
jgi:glutathione-regulated potassium-efflux system ancillary protein KefF